MEQLPLWFLLLSLVLPRVSLLIAYLTDGSEAYNLHGWIPLGLAILVPRVLVLILIFMDRGFSLWLLVHAIVMLLVYLAAGQGSGGSR
jgi:hypothetical protein